MEHDVYKRPTALGGEASALVEEPLVAVARADLTDGSEGLDRLMRHAAQQGQRRQQPHDRCMHLLGRLAKQALKVDARCQLDRCTLGGRVVPLDPILGRWGGWPWLVERPRRRPHRRLHSCHRTGLRGSQDKMAATASAGHVEEREGWPSAHSVARTCP